MAESKLNLGIIGAGNMAGAILNGILKKEIFSPQNINIYDKIYEKLDKFKAKGVNVCSDAREVVKMSDMVLFAIKPQDFEALLESISDLSSGKCFLSIVGGYTRKFISSKLANSHVIRIMPNTPLMLSCGATVISEAPDVPGEYFNTCVDIFSASGIVEIMPDELINNITTVNGSSPAYFYRFVNVIAKNAQSEGIDYDKAVKLCAKSMEGAAKMIMESGMTPEELIRQVSSPGGTTLAALHTMDELKFDETVIAAMKSCTKRAFELGK